MGDELGVEDGTTLEPAIGGVWFDLVAFDRARVAGRQASSQILR